MATEAPRFRLDPRIVAEMPAGWVAREAVELVSLGGPAHVIASAEPFTAPMTLDAFVTRYTDELGRRLAGYEELSLEPFEAFGGVPAKIRRFEWGSPNRPRVRQLQVYAVEGYWGFLITASVQADKAADQEAELTRVIQAVRLRPPAPRGGSAYEPAGVPFDRFVLGEARLSLPDDESEGRDGWATARAGWVATRERFS